MSDAASQTDPWIGRTLADQFRIVKRLGAGGMGRVYLADQIDMDRQVVVKVIHATLAEDPDAVARFRREARTIARLRHPNIVQVFLSGETPEGALYLAMEFVPGQTLGETIQRSGPMPEGRVLHIAEQIAGALATAHAAGVVHRDLKPGNVMLTEHPGNPDHVVVLDFGIAKILHDPRDQAKLTQTGWMMGTPAYMSPEQIEARPLDGRTDIYSLGVMVYEMAAGDNPFEGNTPMECFLRHLKEPVPPPHERYPGLRLSPALEATIQRCLGKDPANRFPSAEALLDALRSIRAGTVPEWFDVPTPEPAKRRRGSHLVVAAVVVLLAALAVMAIALATRSDDGPRLRATGAGAEEGSGPDSAELAPIGGGGLAAPGAVPSTGDTVAADVPDATTGAGPGTGSHVPAEVAAAGPSADAANAEKPPVLASADPQVDRQPPTTSPGVVPAPSSWPRGSPAVSPTPVVAPSPSATRPVPLPATAGRPTAPVGSPSPGRPTTGPPASSAPPATPPEEPVLEDTGPAGAPLVSGARLQTDMGTLVRFTSPLPWQTVVDLYEAEFRGSGALVSRSGSGADAVFSVIDQGERFDFHMLSVQAQPDGSTAIVFFLDTL